MYSKIILVCALLLTSCVSIGVEEDSPTQAVFVTSTLPSTPVVTPRPNQTVTPQITGTPTVSITRPADCTDSAVLVEDVTIPDGTEVSPSQNFTKTWRFINNGTCPWIDYKLIFAAGDQMGAPLSAPIPMTEAKTQVDISVELTAPAVDGSYTAYFTIHNSEDKIVPIGTEKTFWVKITVGTGGSGASPVPTTSGGVVPTQLAAGTTGGGAACNYSQNAGHVSQMTTLINQERANAGLPELTINAALTAAAQGHAADMACNSFVSHTGSDGSSARSRIVAAGYFPTYSSEIIYAGGGPQAAVTWWMNDQLHRDAILNRNVTEMGIGHANSSNSSYGDYFVVDFGSP